MDDELTTRQLTRLRIDLAYDGTDFAGWAAQPGLRTVEGALAEALAVVLREPVELVVAGRTDAGVHATGQVAHADVSQAAYERACAGRGRTVRTPTPPDASPEAAGGAATPDSARLVRHVNGVLPPDVRVRDAAPAPVGFDARFGALERTYVYRIADDPRRVDPLRRHDTVAWRRSLTVGAMHAAGQALVGEHDFLAYCRPRPGASTVRRVTALDVRRAEHGVVEVTVSADAFCHHMVRAVVGALAWVGEGRRQVDWPGALLGARRRDSSVQVAPAHGLTLVAVAYPPDEGLAARVGEARRLRGVPHGP